MALPAFTDAEDLALQVALHSDSNQASSLRNALTVKFSSSFQGMENQWFERFINVVADYLSWSCFGIPPDRFFALYRPFSTDSERY